MNKTDQVYSFIYRKKVVTAKELTHYANTEFHWSYKYLYLKYLRKLVREGRLLRIRKGLYAARNPYDPYQSPPNKYLVGSKIRENYYLGYHTALELLGVGHSVHNGCYIAILQTHPFRPFEMESVHFQGVLSRDIDTEVITVELNNEPVRLSNPSRTFVEVLLRPELAGGYEEIILCLNGLGGVELKSILKVLDIYKNDNLTRKLGFVLERLSTTSPYYDSITDNDLEKIEARIGDGLLYIDKGASNTLIKRWKLYVPQTIINLFEEGV